MKKRIFVTLMTAMTVMMAATGCNSSNSEAETTTSVLDTSVTAKDLLTTENLKTFSEIKELKDFTGAVKLNFDLDASVEVDKEISDIKADLEFTIASDGKVLHTVADANVNTMGKESEEHTQAWYSDETKTQYVQSETDGVWIKYTDMDLESILSEYADFSDTFDSVNVEEILNEFELVLNNDLGVYELKYEASIKDLINKMPEELKNELPEGIDVNFIVDSLNLPDNFKIACTISFNADKTFKDMMITVSSTTINLSELLESLLGTSLTINLNKAEIQILYSETKELSIPEEVIANATDSDS